MGVIKRSKFQHVSPLENGADLPENEPLQTLDGDQAPVPLPVSQQPPATHLSRFSSRSLPNGTKKTAKAEDRCPKGQKKRRRYENNRYLLNLAKSEEDRSCDPGFTESRSTFTTLLQQADKMAAWNAFLTFSEDDQFAIIANNEILAYFNNEAVLDQAPSAFVEKITSYRDTRRAMTPDQAFQSLCPKLKSIFTKRHFPMGILAQLESEVLDFFLDTPKGICVIERSCSFDRLILHAVSQFNVLFSQSFPGEGGRETHIRNICPDFIAPQVSLSEYIRQKRRR